MAAKRDYEKWPDGPAYRKRRKQVREAAYEAACGNPRYVDAKPVRTHVTYLRTCGMRVQEISRKSGVHPTTIRTDLFKNEKMMRRNARALLAVRPPFSTIGLRRRYEALIHKGYPRTWLAEQLGIHQSTFSQFILGRKTCVEFGPRLVELYARLAEKDPAELGVLVPPHVLSRARKRYPLPPTVWDLDTIDRLDMYPEFTGACGTTTGYRIHKEVLGTQPCFQCRCAIKYQQRVGNFEMRRTGPKES